jgi:hypothetical protein
MSAAAAVLVTDRAERDFGRVALVMRIFSGEGG